MKKDICIVHYNTPELTTAAIRSVRKHTPDCIITVFENSDKLPLPHIEGVHIIDNTKSQEVDFQKFLSRFPNKLPTTNDWGSNKHMLSVQKLFDHFPEGFLLLDSDVLIKQDISVFFDDSVAWVGEVRLGAGPSGYRTRKIAPFICYINVPICRKYCINYFDEKRCWELYADDLSHSYYDTGASFLEDCEEKQLPKKEVKIDDYIFHFHGGSHINGKSWHNWLEKHRYLYDDMKTDNKSKPYLVVIPFFKGGAQGREIEYAVAGWRKHFKEKYLIVVVGDYHPVVDTGDDIVFIQCDRVPEQKPENYRPHIDFVKKFKAVRKQFPDSEGFIFVADDCYAVNDFDIYDVMCLKQNGNEIAVPSLQTPWNREKYKTKNLLIKEGYPVRNFTTHLPAWIEWDKLEALWEKYDMENNSYIFEDLYFNIYYSSRIPIQLHIDHDNFKCGVYRPNPRIPYIDKAFKTKIWIQNSVEGWIPYLDHKLSEYYGL